MAKRTTTVVAVVFGAWLGALTVAALHLLTSARPAAPATGRWKELTEEESSRAVAEQLESYDRDASKLLSKRALNEPQSLEKLEEPVEIASIVKKLLKQDDKDPRAAFEHVVALSSLLPKITNISRLKTPSPEAFRGYIAPVGLPVIFTDMFDGSLLRQWSWDYVRSKWGDHVFHNTRQGNYSSKRTTSGKNSVNRVTIKLSDFIDVVTGRRKPRPSEEGLYITKQKVIPSEALETEFFYPPFYPGPHKSCYLEPTAWIGAPGTFTQGHIDSKDNFAYQIIGDKRWTIFSPVDYKYLYYVRKTGSLEWSTALNSLTEPDLKRFPLYTKTTPITFVTKPGEMLYLPRGWTHTVENISPSLMINTWRYGPAGIMEHWSNKSRAEIKKRCFSTI